MSFRRFVLGATVFLASLSTAQGAVTINAVEQDGNVVISGSGTLNLNAWGSDVSSTDFSRVNPTGSAVTVGPTPAIASDRYSDPTNISGPLLFGLGSESFASSGSGDLIGLNFDENDGGEDQLTVPQGYVSGEELLGTSTYNGTTLQALGMVPGTYTWTWGSDADADSITLNVIGPPEEGGTDIVVQAGVCELEDAIQAANNDAVFGGCPAGTGADTILLSADYVVPGGQGTDPETTVSPINSDVTISGQGFTLTGPGSASYRLLKVEFPGVLTLQNITLEGGGTGASTFNGGGVANEQATLIVVDSTFRNNGASNGGAISNFAGVVGITGSTFTANEAGQAGGVIINEFGQVLMVNSTLSGNSSLPTGNVASAIQNESSSLVRIKNSTIFGNQGVGGAAIVNAGDFSMENSILAGNTPVECQGTTITDLSGNFSESTFGPCIFGPAVTLIDTVLADNGGPTLTHALDESSNAVDAAGNCGLVDDQRGVLRSDGACDSGAFELREPCQTLVIQNTEITGNDPFFKNCRVVLGPTLAITSGVTVQVEAARVLFVPEFLVEVGSELAITSDPSLQPGGAQSAAPSFLLRPAVSRQQAFLEAMMDAARD